MEEETETEVIHEVEYTPDVNAVSTSSRYFDKPSRVMVKISTLGCDSGGRN